MPTFRQKTETQRNEYVILFQQNTNEVKASAKQLVDR